MDGTIRSAGGPDEFGADDLDLLRAFFGRVIKILVQDLQTQLSDEST